MVLSNESERWDRSDKFKGVTESPTRMAPRRAHVHAERNCGIRLGIENTTNVVWDKKDHKVGCVSVCSKGVRVRGMSTEKA